MRICIKIKEEMKMKILILMVVVWGSTLSLCAQGKLSEEKRKEFEAQKSGLFYTDVGFNTGRGSRFFGLFIMK